MNIKIPAHQVDAIAQLAKRLGTSETEVVIPLLNAGLDRWQARKRN